MSEARTPEEDTIKPQDNEPEAEEYDGPDPEDDAKGDGDEEDQGNLTTPGGVSTVGTGNVARNDS